jgi:hypothetical protein
MSDAIRGNAFETDKHCKCGRRHFVFNETPHGDDVLISFTEYKRLVSAAAGVGRLSDGAALELAADYESR